MIQLRLSDAGAKMKASQAVTVRFGELLSRTQSRKETMLQRRMIQKAERWT